MHVIVFGCCDLNHVGGSTVGFNKAHHPRTPYVTYLYIYANMTILFRVLFIEIVIWPMDKVTAGSGLWESLIMHCFILFYSVFVNFRTPDKWLIMFSGCTIITVYELHINSVHCYQELATGDAKSFIFGISQLAHSHILHRHIDLAGVSITNLPYSVSEIDVTLVSETMTLRIQQYSNWRIRWEKHKKFAKNIKRQVAPPFEQTHN
jgi:hypothetical protein